MQHGYQCGMLWGAVLAAGARAFQFFGPGAKAETMAIIAAQRLVKSYQAQFNIINCGDLTDINISSSPMELLTHFLLKGGSIRCFRMAAKYAPIAFEEINAALAEAPKEIPSPPISCTAELARKNGLSEMQVVMAAGLAGGIGLSGEACGALGAAIWIGAMESNTAGSAQTEFKDPKALAMIDKFLRCTDFEFECAGIVGRTFENIQDHANFVCSGGCANIIRTLPEE